ncbi:hypothetical protein XELAEV_18047927mg [Xenopus laevis]|uniref:Uncharacterized protein n=1 Tax=Xenopus laevis TaxID=8355 RepID=A0A974BW92_XENLA|nr:hypothetical protein XELAEV_18047927mg [Xenopus laevis]
MAKTSHTVGIFSRDDRDNYNWLMSLLHLTLFHSVVKNVLPKYISNSFMEFEQNVSQCSFAILYHTLKRGRLNITDVTDSLYDEELKHLCETLGKKNVIVVIDDLTDSSDAKMREIIRAQPSIELHACKLFLISEEEKKSCITKGGPEPKWSEIATSELFQEEHNSITAKRNQMKKILDDSSSHEIRGVQYPDKPIPESYSPVPSSQGSSNVRRDGHDSVLRRSPGKKSP